MVAGALFGSFLGKLLAIAFPQGRIHDLFVTEIAAGLHPASLDLRIVEVTAGCMFRFNVMSVVGIALAAALYRRVWR